MAATVNRKRVEGARCIGGRCDSCGVGHPDVVGPILIGMMGWRTFALDGVHKGRAWDARVLLCASCAPRMEAFVASGGIDGQGPPVIRTSEGGFYVDPAWRLSDGEA